MPDDAATIITVQGPIDPATLGTTLTHEHLFIDTVEAWYEPPTAATASAIARRPVAMADRHFIALNPTAHEDNLRLDDVAEAREEVARYQRAGGDALVDVTPKCVGADPTAVRGIARDTGLTIVQGTAFYTVASHPDRVADMSTDAIEAEFVSDVRDGIDDTDVRAGVIGEIGLSGDVHEHEERVVRAGARAARRTGRPLSVHPPLFDDRPASAWGLWILDVAAEEGLPPERVILSHQDLDDVIDNHDDRSNQLEAAERGAFVEFDCWGWEFDNVALNHAFPSDNWRIRATMELIEAGYAEQLLFSQDVWTKIERTTYGGFGYAHVVENALPRLRARGVEETSLRQIMIENPRRALAGSEATD